MEPRTIFIIIHVVTGNLGLLSGIGALILKKGSRWHKISGKLFAISMLTGACSALALTYIKPNLFLTIVAVFTLYMIITGYRILKVKSSSAVWIDWFIVVVAGLLSTSLISLGIYLLFREQYFGIVAISFGGIWVSMVVQDIVRLRNELTRNTRLTIHLSRMIASMIAATTAFTAVNISGSIWGWLAPTVIGSALITFWINKVGKSAPNN